MSAKTLAIGYYTLFAKETHRFMRIWKQSFVPPLITSLLYFVIFGRIIGARVGPMRGLSYMQFILPGMVMMQVMMTAYMNATFSLFTSKYTRSIEQILVSPLAAQLMLLAFISASMLRSLITGVLVIALGLFFTDIHLEHILVVLITFVLTSALFSTLGLINAIYAKNFDDVNVVPTFVITPLTYLGGVFYSIHSLSGIWQDLSLLNPIIYIVNTFRYGILGVSDVAVSLSLLALFGLTLAAYIFCVVIIARGVGLRQ